MTYRRNNQAIHQTSVVLSESGDRGPEPVVIDVPWGTHPA
jgi:hypothetical protein